MKRARNLHFLWAAPLVLLSPVLLGGLRMYYGAFSLQFTPWRWLAVEQLAAGNLPLWNPLSGFGAPLLANYQSAFLYPPNWLLLPFARLGGVGALAWGEGALVALHLVLAGWGMARLARAVGLGVLPQVVTGLAFGLSGYLVARAHFLSINAAAAWLPWVLLAVYRVARGDGRQARWATMGLAGAVGMLLLAGHAQTAWYILLLGGAWALFWLLGPPNANAHSQRNPQSDGDPSGAAWPMRAAWLAGAVLVGALIAGAQLVPTAELLGQSQRAGGADEAFVMTYSFWPWRLLGLFLPGLFGSPASGSYWGYANYWEDAVYIGLLPMLLALRAFFKRQTGSFRPLAIFLAGLTAVSFLLALGSNTPVFPWLYRHVPGFNLFQAPARFTIWAVFALALLAGIGAQSWMGTVSSYSRRQAGRWISVGLAFVLSGVLVLMFLPDIEPSFGRSTLIAGLVGTFAAALGLARARGLFWQTGVLLLVSADLIAAGWGLNPGTAPSIYTEPAPNTPVLQARLDGGRLYLPEADEYALTFDRFFSFRTFDTDLSGLRSSQLPNLNLLEGIRSANQFDPLIPASYADWSAAVEAAPPEQQPWLLAQAGVSMVERSDPDAAGGLRFITLPAAPRAQWYPCALPVPGPLEGLQTLLDAYPANAPMPAVEAGGSSLPDPCSSLSSPAAGEGGMAAILSESYGEVVVQTQSQEDGWLLLRDTDYPGWRVSLDGEEASGYRANGLFRALPVPAGTHEIQWSYSPGSFSTGLVLTVVGLALAAAFWFVTLRPRHEPFQAA